MGAVPGQARECGAAGSLVPWLVPLPRHGSALLALVALVVLDSDLAAFQEHPESEQGASRAGWEFGEACERSCEK